MNIDHDHDDLGAKLAARFYKLRVIPARDPERATAGRTAFLSQARDLAQKNPPTVPVPVAPRAQRVFWMDTIRGFLTGQKKQPMFIKVMAVIIAAVLVFSGAAATAYASQLSLPTDALYGVKTFGENIRLSLAPQSDSKLGLALEFTQRRVDEMAALNRLGMNVPDHVASQYLVQVEYTLQLAAGLSDDHITPALELIRTHLQEQLRILDQLHQANLNDPALIQASEQLNEQLRLVEAGLQNPQQFRQQMRARELEAQQAAPSETERPSPTNTAGAGNNNASAGGNTNENLNGNENNNGNDNGNQDAEGNLNDNPNDNGDDQDGNGNDNGGHGNDNDNGDDNGGNGNDNGDDNGGGNGNENDDENGGGGNSNGDANNNNSVGNGNENDNHNSSRQSD